MKILAVLLLTTNRPSLAFAPSVRIIRHPLLTVSSTAPVNTNNDADDGETTNPYADPNYPDLEFVNYDDPEYQVDQGTDEYFDNTEEQIELMREDRRRRNDEFQFQTYFAEILHNGDSFKGEWTIYKTSTFLDIPNDTNGLPKLVKAARPLKVVSRGFKTAVESDSAHSVDRERICHEEIAVTDAESDPYKSWQEDIDTDSGFGRHFEDDEDSAMEEDVSSPEAKKTEAEIMSNKYWPEHLSAIDFRGHQGIMCVSNAYTISTALPLGDSSSGRDELDGPFSEYRAEIGINSKLLRFRIKFDYSIKGLERSKRTPPLHLKSLTVCREAREMWPRSGKKRSVADRVNADALFGAPGAEGGLYDPPPVGSEAQAGQYMLLDLDGHATVLFPHQLDQDPKAFDGNGWVFSLDWTPGAMRYQVDRKVRSGTELLGLRTLELSEVQSAYAQQYRPRDGGQDMRQ